MLLREYIVIGFDVGVTCIVVDIWFPDEPAHIQRKRHETIV